MDIRGLSHREQAESTAALWIARRERDDWSEQGERELQAWIAADMNHRAAWLRLNAAWHGTTRLRALKTTVPEGVVPAAGEMHLPFFDAAPKSDDLVAEERVRRVSGRKWYSIAAGVAATALMAGVLYHLSADPSYRTDVGGIQTIPLQDGSRVTLNTQTKISVIVNKEERRINLERGEAFFEVAKDPSRPFIVEAAGRKIVAVGTQFSVRRDAEDVRVAVTEGAVRVDDSVLLTPGSVARAQKEAVLVNRKELTEVEQDLSWRTGYLVFDRTPLAQAVAEFNRYNRRQVKIEDPALLAIPVGGSFRASNVEAFLRLIERELPLQAVEKGEEIALRGAMP